MSQYRQFRVRTQDGQEATMFAASRFLDDAERRLIRFGDGREILVPKNLLRPESDGSYLLTIPLSELEQPGPASVGQGRTVIPAIEEQLEVTKRVVETGRLRIHKTVESTDSVIDEPLIHQTYEVERIPVNRIITESVEARYEGDVLILPVMEEVLVVEKRLVLREEVRITPKRTETRDTEKHTLRREHLDVERVSS